MRGGRGFTLVELLVVIVIIAVLAAIAIPTYWQQHLKAQDAVAKSLVREAMIVIESAYIDAKTYDPTVAGMKPDDLHATERPITFLVLAAAATAPTADASAAAIDYTGTDTKYEVGTVSASGKTFGVIVDRVTGITHYVDGQPNTW